MTPRDNVTPVKLEGVVRITDSATLTIGNGVDTTLADLTAASRAVSGLTAIIPVQAPATANIE